MLLSKVNLAPTADAALSELVALVAALVALVAALLACVVAVLAWVVAVVALDAALVALLAAAVALDAAAVAELAALVADVVADAASTRRSHFPLSVFELIGCEPLDVCDSLLIYILLLLVSFMMSRVTYAVDAAQSPWKFPISVVAPGCPLESNPITLLARAVALSVISLSGRPVTN